VYAARTGKKFASFAHAGGLREPYTEKISKVRFFSEFAFEIEK